MASLNNPQNLDKCVDQNIRIMLSPIPVPVDINNYVLEVADRN